MNDPANLAAALIDADGSGRTALLQPYRRADAATAQALAAALKQAYDENFSHDLARAAQASVALDALAALTPDERVTLYRLLEKLDAVLEPDRPRQR